MNPVELLRENSNLSKTDSEYIINILPKRKTKIVYAKKSKNLVYLTVYTDCTTVEDIKNWLKEFEDCTNTTYSIRSTGNNTGRYVIFKQVLHCQHNTRTSKLYDETQKSRTKNTNCPAAITFTLHAIKKRFQGRNKAVYLMRKDTPCEISMILTHNHGAETALRYGKVTSEVRQKLIDLFENGHSPATALEALKTDIYLSHDNPETVLVDRRYCPTYQFCYQLYVKHCRSKFETSVKTEVEVEVDADVDLDADETLATTTSLKDGLEEYTIQTDEDLENAQIIFTESDYAICSLPSTEIEIESTEQYVERGRNAIERLSNIFVRFLEKNPCDVADGLQAMCRNAERLNTCETFLSACTNFATGFLGRNKKNKIPIQSNTIIRRKSNGSRPRKMSKSLKNKTASIVAQIFEEEETSN